MSRRRLTDPSRAPRSCRARGAVSRAMSGAWPGQRPPEGVRPDAVGEERLSTGTNCARAAQCAGSGQDAWQVSSRPPVVVQSVDAPVRRLSPAYRRTAAHARAAQAGRGRFSANNWAAGRRRTGESQTKLAAKCHHRAGNGAFCGEGTAHHRRPWEPAMPDRTADHEPQLLTITEAADVLRAPVATLRYWRHLGTGPTSFRIGRRVLYRRADLRTWIAAQADQSPGQ